MTLFRLILVVLGCLCLALGTLGAFLPVLPTVPLYLLATLPVCQELRAPAPLVHWHQSLQKEPGKLRPGPRHDLCHKASHHRHHYHQHGHWLLVRQPSASGAARSRRHLDLSDDLFLRIREDEKNRRIKNRSPILRGLGFCISLDSIAHFICFARTWMSWAAMEMAISAGVSAWMSRPIGEVMRAKSSSP